MDNIENHELKEIVPDLADHGHVQCINRRDEVVLTRLRIGHTRLARSHLLPASAVTPLLQ